MDLLLKNFFMLSEPMTWVTLLLVVIILALLKYSKKFVKFQVRMFLALIAGFLFATFLQWLAGFPDQALSHYQNDPELLWLYQSHAWIKFLSSLFINFLKLIVIPLIFIGILHVILQLKEDVKLESLLTATLFWLLFTTAIAATTAVTLGVMTDLGKGFISESVTQSVRETKNITEIILGLVPTNIITAGHTNNIIGIVLFAFLIALTARTLRLKHQQPHNSLLLFQDLVAAFHEIMMTLSFSIIKFMPYAIFAMISNTFIQYGFNALKSAALFIVLLYATALIVWAAHLIIISAHKLNPIAYLKKSAEASVVAFTSRSSVATLPVTINALTNMGVSKISASFSATLGTTIGANGCAGYFGALVGIFTLNALGIEVTVGEMISLVILCVVASIGIAGIPGIATMAASIVLTGLGLGDHFGLVAIILAIDPILDMARTFSNVNGSMVSAIATDCRLNLIDRKTFNQI